MKAKFQNLILIVFTLLSGAQCWAWGERGHRTICEVAVHLVKNPSLSKFLKQKSEKIGHLCNTPDIIWKSSPEGKRYDFTHYLNPEAIPIELKDIPSDLPDVLRELNLTSESLPKLGTLWWTADQFYRLALDSAKHAKSEHFSQYQGRHGGDPITLTYINFGLLGHFVGDAGQPFHNTLDYNGIGSGHHGIHSFYEESCVSELPLSLGQSVYENALELRKRQNIIPSLSVPARMKNLSVTASSDIPAILELDKFPRPSAERASRVFEKKLIEELARSSLLLAEFWDEIYDLAGRPDFSTYRSFYYPYAVPFVAPNFLD